MSRFPRSLIAAGLLTVACAHPRAAPDSPPVPWETFAPYLVANVWPHAVTPLDEESFVHVKPADEDRTLRASVQVHYGICLGRIYRGQGLIEAADDRLLQLGCEVAQTLPEVTEPVAALVSAALKSPECPEGENVGPQLRCVRTRMAAQIAAAPQLRETVCQRFPGKISDCR